MTATVRRWLVGGAQASAVVAAIATPLSVWLFLASRRLVSEPVHYLYGDAVAGLLYPVVGAYLVRRRPDNLVGWIFAATSVLGINALCNQYAVWALLGDSGFRSLGLLAAWLAAWGWAPALFVPTLLPLYFPDGTLPSRKWRWYARLVVAILALLLLAGMVAPHPIDATDAILNPVGRLVPGWVSGLVTVPAVLIIFVLTPISVGALILRLRRAAGRVRSQLSWLSLAALVALVCALSSGVLPDQWSEATWAVGSAAIPVGVLIAVARHQLLDIEIVLQRAIVYVLLTGLVVAAYVLAVVGVGTAAGQRIGIVAVAALALLAAAVRNRLNIAVSRLLYGERHDPFSVVRQLGQRLDAASGPSEALAQLAVDVRGSLRLPYLAVEPASRGLGAVSSGSVIGGKTAEFPVMVLGQPVATLVVGLRRGTSRLTDEERAVLHDVARRAGGLVHAAGLLDDLQRSRERIVIAREEERRRLRRDLHDGVGPQLAGMALQLDSLMRRLSEDPVTSERASQIRDRMRTTVADVRRVVDDLRPPALDELGLVGALRQQVSVFQTEAPTRVDEERFIRVVVDGELPDLPAAVEVAAFRIASEAVANAVRHGSCSRCTVTLRRDDDCLLVEICDDGRGIDQDTLPHVGLLTMRERAVELGGRIVIESRPGRTSVQATLPLEGSQ